MERVSSHTPFLSHFRWPAAEYTRKKRTTARNILDPNPHAFRLEEHQMLETDPPNPVKVMDPLYNPWHPDFLPAAGSANPPDTADPVNMAVLGPKQGEIASNAVDNPFHDRPKDGGGAYVLKDENHFSQIRNPFGPDGTIKNANHLPNYSEYDVGDSNGSVAQNWLKNQNHGDMILNKDDPAPKWTDWKPQTVPINDFYGGAFKVVIRGNEITYASDRGRGDY